MRYSDFPPVTMISIHAPREGGDSREPKHRRRRRISIHAPREGGDVSGWAGKMLGEISIHAPREGGDPGSWRPSASVVTFQSTPPARGATSCGCCPAHPPRFQSTPPARGATGLRRDDVSLFPISIHAPREGGDSKDAQFYLRIFDKQVELLRFLGKYGVVA